MQSKARIFPALSAFHGEQGWLGSVAKDSSNRSDYLAATGSVSETKRKTRRGSLHLFALLLSLQFFSTEGKAAHAIQALTPPPKAASPTNSPAIHAVVYVPKEFNRFSLCQKWNPIWWIGNADDPVPPASYRPGKRGRKFSWYVRNPFHNFTFYVIGLADKPFLRTGRYANRVANPNGGWNWAISRYQWWWLPFVDYRRGGFEFYIGWRNGGNFGVKLNFGQKHKK